jgi:hypothetical protein
MMYGIGGQPRQVLRASAVITVLVLLVRFHHHRSSQIAHHNELNNLYRL